MNAPTASTNCSSEPVCRGCGEPAPSCDCEGFSTSNLVCPDCRRSNCICFEAENWVELPEFRRKPAQRMQMDLFDQEVA